ncbi:MAG TPA: translation initiation factor 2 [Pseudomonas sp.]|uniref:translation initiation factor 2 n=1 Tax=Pseudomonas sp. TaxID=306 RepID=UPI002ED7A96C
MKALAPQAAPAEESKATADVNAAQMKDSAPAGVSNASSIHELAPNVSVVPVVAASRPLPVTTKVTPASIPQKAQSGNAKSSKVKEDNAEIAHRAPVSSKTKTPAQVVKDTHLPKPTLDLSLPPEMVKQLTPPGNVITAAPQPKPLLPKMFPDSQGDPDFQLNGRLLSNEMQLQLRNEARRDVEGAAVDFTFKK